MKYRIIGNEIYLRIDKGEPVFKTIKGVCDKENILMAHFQGIGGCGEATVATLDEETLEFKEHKAEGVLEAISFMGNVSKGEDGKAFLHAHAAFSYIDENGEHKILAGHMIEAIVKYTAEIIINFTGETLGRVMDDNAGITVWDL